jgi:excisionase family DNA binding protein
LTSAVSIREMSPNGPSVSGDRLLTASDVAELLAVPERWVREHTRGGLIPHVRLGRYVRYRHDAVVSWINEHEHSGAAWRKHRPQVPRTSASEGDNGKLLGSHD